MLEELESAEELVAADPGAGERVDDSVPSGFERSGGVDVTEIAHASLKDDFVLKGHPEGVQVNGEVLGVYEIGADAPLL